MFTIHRTSDASDGAGGVQLSRPGDGGNETAAFNIGDHFNEEGVFSKGQYDDGDSKFTKEFIESNPHVAKLAKSALDSRAKITKLTQGKIPLGEPIPDHEFAKIDWTPNEDGAIREETLKALEGRPITAQEAGFVFDLVQKLTADTRADNESWAKEWHDKVGGKDKYDAMMAWAGEHFDDDTFNEINGALATKTFRDDAMNRIINAFKETTGAGGGDNAPGPKFKYPVSNTQPADNDPGDRSEGETGINFSATYSADVNTRRGQYAADRAAVERAPKEQRGALMKKVDAKLERSVKAHGQDRMVSVT